MDLELPKSKDSMGGLKAILTNLEILLFLQSNAALLNGTVSECSTLGQNLYFKPHISWLSKVSSQQDDLCDDHLPHHPNIQRDLVKQFAPSTVFAIWEIFWREKKTTFYKLILIKITFYKLHNLLRHPKSPKKIKHSSRFFPVRHKIYVIGHSGVIVKCQFPNADLTFFLALVKSLGYG